MIKKALNYITIAALSITLCLSPAGNIRQTTAASAKTKKNYVFVVYNGKSVVYHRTKACRTLSRSKYISKVKLKVAKSQGRRKCKVCY